MPNLEFMRREQSFGPLKKRFAHKSYLNANSFAQTQEIFT